MHPRQVAERFDVSVGTVYKWLRRFAQGGEAALRARSSRPHRSPRRLAVQRVATIAALRRMRLSSPETAASLSLPGSSVTNELRHLGLNKLSRLEPRPPALRYEYTAPGDMVHIDLKKLGRIDGVGHRITGDRSKRKRGAGREHLHSCVDYHSRLAYTEPLPDEKAANWFARHGVKISRLMTDNGSAYVSYRFRKAIAKPSARQVRTRPQALHPARAKGKAELFIQPGIREWARKHACESSAERAAHLLPWLHDYNHRRPHAALNHRPALSRLAICAEPL